MFLFICCFIVSLAISLYSSSSFFCTSFFKMCKALFLLVRNSASSILHLSPLFFETTVRFYFLFFLPSWLHYFATLFPKRLDTAQTCVLAKMSFRKSPLRGFLCSDCKYFMNLMSVYVLLSGSCSGS